MPLTIGRGSMQVQIGGALEASIRRTIDRLAPGLGEVLEAEAQQLRDGAVERWPVGRDRGRPHSRDLFTNGLRITDKGVEAFVSNPAPYLYLIKSGKNGLNGKSASVELLRKPLKKAAARAAERCGETLRKLIREP